MSTDGDEGTGVQALEDLELDLIVEGIRKHYGLDLEGVDRAYLRHRIRSRRDGEGLETPLELLGRVLRQPASFNEFHLILIRRELSPFDDPLRERSVRVRDESLIRFGFLMVGPPKSSGPRPRVPESCRPILRRVGLNQKVYPGGAACRSV